MAEEGEWAVVLEVFPDGSATVRVEEGRDVPLLARECGPVEPGESGRLYNRKKVGHELRFVGRGRP